ncbi:MAG: PilZ domain-containing protein [Holophagaceae bacterium]|nr:PilZ domain-containing protein [Holophagaceae bacterium]
MSEPIFPSDEELETMLRDAKDLKASVSLRAMGSNRMLGDLRLAGIEPGIAMHLIGAKRRDQLPEEGTMVTLSIILGDQVVSLDSPVLTPLVATEGDTMFPPILRLAWPARGLELKRRRDMRMASADQAPLVGKLKAQDQTWDVKVLNLTETGMGLALPASANLPLRQKVQVQTTLPGGALFSCHGEIRHLMHMEGDPLPTRAGVVFWGQPGEGQEDLRRFIQDRRTDRSQSLREPEELD